jgi:hypothetical protein
MSLNDATLCTSAGTRAMALSTGDAAGSRKSLRDMIKFSPRWN